MKTEQIERIEAMETILDRAREAVLSMDSALSDFVEAQDQIEELDKYYSSGLWREDFEADEAGELPEDLKRGVLSEDAVYDLLTDNRDLINDLLNVAEQYRFLID